MITVFCCISYMCLCVFFRTLISRVSRLYYCSWCNVGFFYCLLCDVGFHSGVKTVGRLKLPTPTSLCLCLIAVFCIYAFIEGGIVSTIHFERVSLHVKIVGGQSTRKIIHQRKIDFYKKKLPNIQT